MTSKPTRVIGISGRMGAGKDTVADILSREFGFAKVALADPIKRVVREIYDFSIDSLWGPSELRNSPDPRYPRDHEFIGEACACCGSQEFNTPCFLTPRWALQVTGTQMGRRLYENTWIDTGLRVAESLLRPNSVQRYLAPVGLISRPQDPPVQGVAIPDIRFKNEMRALKARGLKIVRIRRAAAETKSTHQSETEQLSIPDSEFDWVVNNNGNIDDLTEQLTTIFGEP